MSVLFINEENLPRIDALIVSEGEALPDGEYISVAPIDFGALDRFSVGRAVSDFFGSALFAASKMGYTAVAIRFPVLNSRTLYTCILGVDLIELAAPYDVDLYIIIGEREKRIIRGIVDIDDVVYPKSYSRKPFVRASFNEAPPIEEISYKRAKGTALLSMANASIDGEYESVEAPYCCESVAPLSLANFIRDMDDTFAVRLLKLIDMKGMDEVRVYKAANVSRQTWYKIMNEGDYRPSKVTVICFAIALELDFEETQALLATAGFTLSGSIVFDKIISYCIREGIYDVFEINQMLYSYDQECLGA